MSPKEQSCFAPEVNTLRTLKVASAEAALLSACILWKGTGYSVVDRMNANEYY
jgi:hypothetical protein